jgi:hypothetical protein
MTPAIKTLYRAILKEGCLITPHETEQGLVIRLWDPTGQKKKYLFRISQKEGVNLLMAKSRADWDEGHPSGSFSLINRLPGVF